MTAAVEWRGNLAVVESPRWQAVTGEEDPPVTGSLPARLSPRPCRVLARRIARSQAAADLRDAALVIGLFLALLLGAVAHDQLHALASALTGGTRP